MKREKAFTLVELLVVISIIALLLSILMPSLNKARLAGQRVVCMNDSKQQMLFQLMYASDAKGKFPNHKYSEPWYVRAPDGPEETLHAAYKNYVGTGSKVFVCPALTRFAREDAVWSGYYADTRWTNAALDLGGWDAKLPNGNIPAYIGIPYNWYNNFDPMGATIDFASYGETPWAKNLAECKSTAVSVTHITSIAPIQYKMRDRSHGGSVGWGIKPTGNLFASGNKTLDNPVGYADGHVQMTLKSKMKVRASYSLRGKIVQVAY